MTAAQCSDTTWSDKYVLELEHPIWPGVRRVPFDTDLEAMLFAANAVRHGATVVRCVAPLLNWDATTRGDV